MKAKNPNAPKSVKQKAPPTLVVQALSGKRKFERVK